MRKRRDARDRRQVDVVIAARDVEATVAQLRVLQLVDMDADPQGESTAA